MTEEQFGAAIVKVCQSLTLTLTLTLYHSGPSLWRADTLKNSMLQGALLRNQRRHTPI